MFSEEIVDSAVGEEGLLKVGPVLGITFTWIHWYIVFEHLWVREFFTINNQEVLAHVATWRDSSVHDGFKRSIRGGENLRRSSFN